MDRQDVSTRRIAWSGELIYLRRLSPRRNSTTRLSQRLAVARASIRGSQLLRVRRSSTRIVRFKFRAGMFAGEGSAPWPVHRGVLSRFPPNQHDPLVRVHFFGENGWRPSIHDATFVHKTKIIIESPRVCRDWPISNRNILHNINSAVTFDCSTILKWFLFRDNRAAAF